MNEKINADDYINNQAWISRSNGRDLNILSNIIEEDFAGDEYIIKFFASPNLFMQWEKTLKTISFKYSIQKDGNYTQIKYHKDFYGSIDSKILRWFAHKAATCVSCGSCESNCPHGSIRSKNGIKIDNCKHCGLCYSINEGCHLYNSIRLPKYGLKTMKNINTYTDYAPKPSWITSFFNKGTNFIEKNGLGPMEQGMFKKFLRESELIKNNITTDLFNKIINIGKDSTQSWSIILINLIYNNIQFSWYLKNMPLNSTLTREQFDNILLDASLSDRAIKSVRNAYARICNTPLGKIINFGSYVDKNKNRSENDQINVVTVQRTKPVEPDPRVLLYGLYKFAEACDGYYQITLGRLMDFEVESSGISPAEIFGLSRDEMTQYLRGLAQNYPDFVRDYSSTHGLERLDLNPEKTSADVLELF